MKRLALTRHTVRCPVEDCTARLMVRTDTDASPSRRHRDVVACSLLPATSWPQSERTGYFPDLTPVLAYVAEPYLAPCHSSEIACSKRCLAVLNAAEAGGESPQCTSGVSDALELARQTQSFRMMQVLWSYSG
jgi:hypothetical protein